MDYGTQQVRVFVDGNEHLPPMHINMQAQFPLPSANQEGYEEHHGIVAIDADGDVLIGLHLSATKIEQIRMSSEKLSAASHVLKHMILDAQEDEVRKSSTFQMSPQSPVSVTIPEGFGGDVVLLLFLMHGIPDACVRLAFHDNGESGEALIRLEASSGLLESNLAFGFAELTHLANKYQCRPVMYHLHEMYLKGMEDGMDGLSLLVQMSLRYDGGNEKRFLDLTGKMLSLETSELDELKNAVLRELLKSKKLELLEIRRSVSNAQWGTMVDLQKYGHVTYRLRNVTEGQAGQCTPASRMELLLKIFDDAERLAKKYERALDKVKDRNIYQKALSEASDLHPHDCEGRLTDCPLNWAIDQLSMHKCNWAETPKGVSLQEFRAKNGDGTRRKEGNARRPRA